MIEKERGGRRGGRRGEEGRGKEEKIKRDKNFVDDDVDENENDDDVAIKNTF